MNAYYAAMVKIDFRVLRALLDWPEDVQIGRVLDNYAHPEVALFTIRATEPARNTHGLPVHHEGDQLVQVRPMYSTPPGEFTECDTCRAQPGTPQLCEGCLKNRRTIEDLRDRARKFMGFV